jgi:hypothetical protein
MVLQSTFGAQKSLSTDHPFIDDDWPASRNGRSIARQGAFAGQESGPLSGPTRQQLPSGSLAICRRVCTPCRLGTFDPR